MAQAFIKIVHPGYVHLGGTTVAALFCKIKFDGSRLSITGVEGPLHNGNCKGSCGQISMHEWDMDRYSEGWDADRVAHFRQVWSEWHLNDMRPGSPAQQAWLKANPITAVYPESHYEKARDALRAAGLHPDKNHMYNGKPYAYGSAWLNEDVPEDVLSFLQSLPDSTVTPAWV